MSDDQQLSTNLPDPAFVQALAQRMRAKVEASQDTLDQLLADCGMQLNWVGEWLTDKEVAWKKRELLIDNLTLTGTQPAWNTVILDECERSPKKLRERLASDVSAQELFSGAIADGLPILVRIDGETTKVLDGMRRTIAAIRDGQEKIWAWVGRRTGKGQPVCEPHVIYDLLRVYDEGINPDRSELSVALRYLKQSFANVESLLRRRFDRERVRNDELQKVIAEVLGEPLE